MKCPEGKDFRVGDEVELVGGLVGVVQFCTDKDYLREHPEEREYWQSLGAGIMVRTEEAGLVFCNNPSQIVRLRRRST